MPKATYTDAKGHHQKSGKGLDFTSGAGLNNRRAVVDGSGGNVDLGADDSGAIVVVSGGARTVTLPTVAAAKAGFYVDIVSASAHAHVLDISGGANSLQGLMIDSGNASTVASAPITDMQKITLANPRIGDRISVFCDGTSYHVTAILNDTASLSDS